MTIQKAQTDGQILACYPVTAELRPHVAQEEFVSRIRKQEKTGFELVYLEDQGYIVAVAGIRIGESLAWGRYLYVYDLSTAERHRSKGFGGRLLDWIVAYARERGCDQVHLDSGVQRFGAHRFYLAHRMDITSHHFALRLR